MAGQHENPSVEQMPAASPLAETAALWAIVEGVESEIGERFFPSLVRHLAGALGVQYAFVSEFTEDRKHFRTRALWGRGALLDNFESPLAGTPCEAVLNGQPSHHSEYLQALFPDDRGLVAWRAESYCGVPLLDVAGMCVGHLAIVDDQPMPDGTRGFAILRIFAMRAYAELERLRAEDTLLQNAYLREEIRSVHNIDEMIGQSRAMRAVLEQVRLVAGTDSSVLILGETGTGKELIARAIHAQSPRQSRPLLKVNCAALPAGLVESELFGHEKGAFTGATEKRLGRFELAHGGTIFLDEIGEMPLEAQSKLLRVLQEQEFERVGGSKTLRVDVRVIAATNRDLNVAVAEGTFRQDLYYRLHVFPVQLPPLRQRPDDIPLLVHYFVARYAAKIGRPISRVPQEVMQRLSVYAWPGNIRELENVIERAVILSAGPDLTVAPQVLPVGANVALSAPSPAMPLPPFASSPDALALEEVERNHILLVLKHTGWRIDGPQGAARVLNLHPSTLRSRIKKLGMQRGPKEFV